MAEKSTVSLSVERNVAVPMRDGTILYADVYRPAGPGPFPALLTRSPYDKAVTGAAPFTVRAATAGYAVVIQDVRGRFESEGEFYAFVNERQDGYDTLEWLASQPWCDGKIGMFGGSYVGLTQWQAALSGHPALKAIVPNVTAANYHNGWTYQGGAFELQFNLSWTLSVLAINTSLRANNGDINSPAFQAIMDASDNMTPEFEKLPLTGNEVFGEFARYYDDWVNHPTYDDFWSGLDVSRGWESITAASFSMGGWHDIFLGGTIDNFAGMTAASGDGRHRLMIGPWNHGGMRTGNPIGDENFGMRSTGAVIDEGGMHLRWYDRWLRDIDNGIENDPPVKLFVMGSNRWREAQTWPLENTDWQEWFLHSGGTANTLNGDGALSREAPGGEPADSYVYNPRNPVPTRGGGLCCNNVFSLGGAWDQREVEQREDVLVYTSAPMEKAREVTGPIKVILYASSSATDTDFTAKLVDVGPCGYARNLTDGIIRARYRESMAEGTLITPGEVIEYEIDLWATSNLFKEGHRIRVEISSSNFPRFDRNPNTGELPGRSTEMVSALQTIHHSTEYPSRIVLPVINDPAGP
ncbi:MAG TPA: CocE/NonD family hydrolase [Thermomicrobiales bacterium]|nr:CocE/NonD family hydrolase [Thermomicrobiales bacterium]